MEVKIKGIYKHYKGDLYLVEDIAKHSETCQKMVIYRGLYNESPLWARPYDLFIDKLPDDKVDKYNQKHRFELQSIKSIKNG